MTNRTPAPDKPSPPRRPTLAPGPALALSLALALTLAAPARAQKSPQPGDHGTPGELPGLAEGIEVGLGADQRVSLAKANQLLLEAKLAEAERLIDGVLSYFEKQTADTRRDYVSVANREQFDRYRKEHPSNRELVWLDWGYGRALFLKGWIASAQARWKDAEVWLDRAIKVQPYSEQAHGERGYVLNHNQQGRYAEAAKSYETDLSLARTYPINKRHEGSALRGLSYALIEMNDLPGARKALRESLKVEPESRLARRAEVRPEAGGESSQEGFRRAP